MINVHILALSVLVSLNLRFRVSRLLHTSGSVLR